MLSIIIPAINEANTLPKLLRELQSLNEKCSGAKPLAFECIVVDGGSTDGTAEACAQFKAVRWFQCEPNRARQMNYGAEQAKGSWYWFLHADSLPDARCLETVKAQVQSQSPVIAAFPIQFNRSRPILRLIAWWSNRRARSGFPYGDQSLLVPTELFDFLGGFDELHSMEDFDFVLRARKHHKPICLPGTITTSSRRFDEHGDLKTGFESLRLGWRRFRGAKTHRSKIFFTEVR